MRWSLLYVTTKTDVHNTHIFVLSELHLKLTYYSSENRNELEECMT